MSSMPGTWCLPRFGLSFHSHTAKLDRPACAFFFLPDEPAGAAPSSPEESGNRILCFSSASGVLAFLLLSWALPAVFQWAVLQTLSPFLAAKHCTRWPQAPGSSGRCDTKSQLETEHFFFLKVRTGSCGRFRHLHDGPCAQTCKNVTSRTYRMAQCLNRKRTHFYLYGILTLVFPDISWWLYVAIMMTRSRTELSYVFYNCN